MRNKWFIILGVTVMLLFGTAFSASALKIADLSISDPFITVGESFDVSVSVYDDGSLGDLVAFGFDVDPLGSLSLLSYDGCILGTNFDDVSVSPNNVSGLYFDPLSEPQPKELLLATLSFTALDVGTEFLRLEGVFDGFDGLVYLSLVEDIFGSKDITINSASVPEPASILLLSTGVFGFWVLRKKVGMRQD